MRVRPGAVVFVSLIALLQLLSEGAAAHTRSQSFSSWHIAEGRVRLIYSASAYEVTRLAPLYPAERDLGALLGAHLAARIGVRAGTAACLAAAAPRPIRARKGFIRVEWELTCETDTNIAISIESFFELAPSHVHYARVLVAHGPNGEYLFTDAQRTHVVVAPASQASVSETIRWPSYVDLGARHILAGFDHLAFLAALLLLCRRVREVVLMVTGFTLGHSVTLCLAVLGLVEPRIPVIESLIGFTIAIVAIENIGVRTGSSRSLAWAGGLALGLLALFSVWTGSGLPLVTLAGLTVFSVCYLRLSDSEETAARWRPLVTSVFGLVHGFGFASVLMEIGLPAGRLASALFGFNLGVELGQLSVVAALWLVGRGLVRRVPRAYGELGFEVLSAALCALGIFWFLGRGLAA